MSYSSGISAQASYPTLKTIHYFVGAPEDGAEPKGGIVIGNGKVLYGTTQAGGSGGCSSQLGCGTVFAFSPPASSGGTWTETVLHNFTGYPGDGSSPGAGVVIGGGEVLYGVTSTGGNNDYGAVYSLMPPDAPGKPWTEAIIYSFRGVPDGVNPASGLIVGDRGVLYGATYSGGIGGYGVVFSLTPPTTPTGSWAEAVLYNFTGGTDGAGPGKVLRSNDGVLYGTTHGGGSLGQGTVFSLTAPPDAGEWIETVLYNFTGRGDGSSPTGGLVSGSDGVLYGTTLGTDTGGGATGGTVFSMTPTPNGAWTQTVLYQFRYNPSGARPSTGVVIGSGGVLYGTTVTGGAGPNGDGTVYSLSPPVSPGKAWAVTVLHYFSLSNGAARPNAGVVIGAGGVLYGTATDGGDCTICGSVYSVTP